VKNKPKASCLLGFRYTSNCLSLHLLGRVDISCIVHACPSAPLACHTESIKYGGCVQSFIVDIGGIFDSDVNHGKSEYKAGNEQDPGGDEYVHKTI
jgi:hypothetical protein